MRPLSSKIFTRTPKRLFLLCVLLVKMYQRWNKFICFSSRHSENSKSFLPRPPLGWEVGKGDPTLLLAGNRQKVAIPWEFLFGIFCFRIRIIKLKELGPIQLYRVKSRDHALELHSRLKMYEKCCSLHVLFTPTNIP